MVLLRPGYPRRGGPMCPPGGDTARITSTYGEFVMPTPGGHTGPPLRRPMTLTKFRKESNQYDIYQYTERIYGSDLTWIPPWGRTYVSARQRHRAYYIHLRRIRNAYPGRTHRSAPNANRLRAKHSKGKKGTPKIVNVHNLCLPKLCHITMANVFLVFSFLLFCPALVQNVPVVWEPDAQTMFSESCLGAIDARMGCPRQSQQLNGLSTLPI